MLKPKPLKVPLDRLQGELDYRDFFNNLEREAQGFYRYYQEWRMAVGLLMKDIDALVSDSNIETFNGVKTLEYSMINKKCINHAMLEMKHANTGDETIQYEVSSSTPAKELATTASLPFYVVKYYPAHEFGEWNFVVYPANPFCALQAPTIMSEKEFVEFLYSLRKLQVPAHILNQTSTVLNEYCSI